MMSQRRRDIDYLAVALARRVLGHVQKYGGGGRSMGYQPMFLNFNTRNHGLVAHATANPVVFLNVLLEILSQEEPSDSARKRDR